MQSYKSIGVIHIWPKNGAHAYIWAEIVYGSSGDYWLSIGDYKSKLRSYDAYWNFWFFWVTFYGKMGVTIKHTPGGLAPSNPTENLAHWVDNLSQPLSLKNVFGILRSESFLNLCYVKLKFAKFYWKTLFSFYKKTSLLYRQESNND